MLYRPSIIILTRYNLPDYDCFDRNYGWMEEVQYLPANYAFQLQAIALNYLLNISSNWYFLLNMTNLQPGLDFSLKPTSHSSNSNLFQIIIFVFLYILSLLIQIKFCTQYMLMKLTAHKRQHLHQMFREQPSNQLDLTFADLADQELQYLFTLYLQHTLEINLSCNQICLKFRMDPGTIQWKNLQKLNLNNNLIQGKSIKFLLNIYMNDLNSLSLSNNQLNDHSIKMLAKNQWNNITVINLAKNKITDKGMLSLVHFCWKNLKALFLQQNWIGSLGKRYLLKADWQKLSRISCYHQFLRCNGQDLQDEKIEKLYLDKFGDMCQVYL